MAAFTAYKPVLGTYSYIQLIDDLCDELSARFPGTGATGESFTFIEKAGTYVDLDTTPTVANAGFLSISNSAPTIITNLDNGTALQRISLYFNDANTTLNRDNALLAGGANFVSTASDHMELTKIGSVWVERNRSLNS